MISIAESITGGMIMSELTNISGISKYFKGGIVCYSLESKYKILKTDFQETYNYNGISINTVIELVENVCKKFNTPYGIATTGYAENYENETPQCYIAVKENENLVLWYITNDIKQIIITNLNTQQSRHIFQDSIMPRNEFRQFITKFAINLLTKYIK